MRPNSRQEISLEFQSNRKLVGLGFAQLTAKRIDFVHRAKQGLNVMTNFVRDYIGLRKISGRAKSRLQVMEER